MCRWLSWQQYGCDVVVIHRVVSPSTWSIVLRVNATCAYTWRATFAHLEPMHSLTAAPCPIISGYGSKVKDRITCRSIGSGSPRPRLLMNAINCHCSAKYEACTITIIDMIMIMVNRARKKMTSWVIYI